MGQVDLLVQKAHKWIDIDKQTHMSTQDWTKVETSEDRWTINDLMGHKWGARMVANVVDI